MEFGRVLKTCRMCGGEKLYKFLDLGFTPPSDAIISFEDLLEPEIFFPLNVLQCEDCGLTQLGYVVNSKLLYGSKYKYESSITETGKKHFFLMADSICKRFDLKNKSLAVDIGSNVGVLLEGFKKNGMEVLGIDPAVEIYKIANERNIETWHEFFNPAVAERIKIEKGRAKIITGTNVFAHIDDKEGLLKSLDILLEEDGVFVFEVPYLVDLIENLEYDTIYLEHLEYISVKPLINFFKKHNFDVFDVEKYDIHGKSIRVFVCRTGKIPISGNIEKFILLENEKKIYNKETLDEFAKKVALHKEMLINLLRDIKKDGKKIIGISAPAKGNTVLNYCKIGADLIDYIAEKSLIKKGGYTPGMHIPIVGEEKIMEDKPDYGIIFAWNFAEEIIRNNENFSKAGGKFIIPIPSPIIK
ncbi:MAG: class I SAM-dependent methyltransferase [Candidatus Staskawiczbacteria bacterium]|nr:class I SAM-dependent methyltransferase [Candidatus Staskawiczbacteria bacterium]